MLVLGKGQRNLLGRSGGQGLWHITPTPGQLCGTLVTTGAGPAQDLHGSAEMDRPGRGAGEAAWLPGVQRDEEGLGEAML